MHFCAKLSRKGLNDGKKKVCVQVITCLFKQKKTTQKKTFEYVQKYTIIYIFVHACNKSTLPVDN